MISAIFKRSTSFVRGKQAEELYERVQSWIRRFDPEQLPKQWFYSKSRGPGGQNVNKVNTKAELRVVPSECNQLPQELRDHLPPVLIFKSDQFRTQPDNMEACLDALKVKIQQAAEKVAPRPTSQRQMNKVQRLRQEADAGRREQKDKRSSKKSSRNMERSWKKDN